MKKQHILGFFDSLVRTPAFLFLCAMFLCGALAGGLGIAAAVATGLGPVWYAVAVAVTGPLCTLAGGWIQARRAARG